VVLSYYIKNIINMDKKKWGASNYRVFIFKLGKIIETKNIG